MTANITNPIDPCLSFVKQYRIPNPSRYDWIGEINQNPCLEELQLERRDRPHFPRLATAIHMHPRITKLQFQFLDIGEADMIPLCAAITDKQQLVTLKFCCCVLRDHATAILRRMLRANSIEGLSFHDCAMPFEAYESIARAICWNQSLKTLQFCWGVRDPTPTLRMMECLLHEGVSTRHRGLSRLCLRIHDGMRLQEFFRAMERQNTLQCFEIEASRINLPFMEDIMSLCLATESLKTLGLRTCDLDPMAIDYLAESLSRSPATIDELNLSRIRIGGSPVWAPLAVAYGDLQVTKLVVEGFAFQANTMSQMLRRISTNPFIKSLVLRSDLASRHWQKYCRVMCPMVCELLLRRNIGPQELVLDAFGGNYAKLLTQALVKNTRLESLTISNIQPLDLVVFAQGLASLRSLRKLAFDTLMHYSKEFFHALQESLERNIALVSISFDDLQPHDTNAEEYLPRIRHLLESNRTFGRYGLIMRMPDVPVGLWAPIVARSSPNGIYFVLTENPDKLLSYSQKLASESE